MSRLDYLTIGIVIVCVAALGFLIWRTIGLMDKPTSPTPTTAVTTPAADEGDNYEPESYEFDDEGEIITDDADLDDEEVVTYNEDEISDEPLDDSGVDLEQNIPADELDMDDAEEPEEERVVATDVSVVSGDYLVIAGSFRYMESAKAQVRRLKKKGYENARVEPFNGGAYAVALVDRFDDLGDARSLKKELADEGIEAIVQKKKGN
ncbi:MAG: SPOR domain-containing protein [Bacteroidota bacterium]